MRRESSPPSSTRPPASPATKGTELLAAYCDGVSELTPSERKRVELYLADDKTARGDEAATRDLIGKLRELPPQGEPDWTALERSIHDAVGESVPRPFWKRWRFAVPTVLALAGAAAILVLVLRGTEELPTAPDQIVHVPVAPDVEPAPVDEKIAVYLDGTDLELALEASELADDRLDEMTFAGLDHFDTAENLLGEDLAWVDELDDAELQKLDALLDHKKGKGG